MIYIVNGNDKYFVDQEINNITKDLKIDDFDTVRFNGSSNSFNVFDMIEACISYPMFSENKLVYVFNPLFFKKKNLSEKEEGKLLEFFNEKSNGYILIFYGDFEIDSSKVIYKTLKKNCKHIKPKTIDEKEFSALLRKTIKDNNMEIDEKAITELLYRLPLNVNNLQKEIDKLTLINEKITVETIKKVVPKPIEEDIFEFINNLSNKKLKESMKIWQDFKVQNKEAVGILLILSTQLRFMYQVKYLKSKNYNNAGIAKELKTSEGRVYYTTLKIGQYSLNDLLEMLNRLAELDQSIKSGIIEPNNAMELFILEMTR